mgnify:CR=1 FL=1
MDLQHPRAIKRVTVHTPSTGRRSLLIGLALVCYAAALTWCYATMGEPYAAAQAQAAAIAEAASQAEREAIEAAGGVIHAEFDVGVPLGGADDEDLDLVDADVFDELALDADASIELDDADTMDAEEEMGDEDDDGIALSGSDAEEEDSVGDEADAGVDVDDSPVGNDDAENTMPPVPEGVDLELFPELNPDIVLPPLPTPEEEAAQRPLPSPYLPNAWAAAFLFLVMSCHALFHLLCRWLKWFEAATLYGPASTVRAGAYVLVSPQPHRGRAAIARVKWLEGGEDELGDRRLCFVFQRQRYEFLTASEVAADPATARVRAAGKQAEASGGDDDSHAADDGALVGLGASNGGVRPMESETASELRTYLSASGVASQQVSALQERFGKNVLTIPTPKFFDLYTEQLLSPLAIFQFFCAILWMLDEYWQYTMFTFASSAWHCAAVVCCAAPPPFSTGS